MRTAKIGLALWSFVSLAACSAGFKPAHLVLNSPPYSESKIEILASAVDATSSQGYLTGEKSYRNVLLPKGTSLILTLKSQCSFSTESTFSSLQRESGDFDSSLYTRSWTLAADTFVQDLRSQVDAEECIVGVSENSKVYLTQTQEDPRRRFQRDLDYTHLNESFEFFLAPDGPGLAEVVIAVLDSGVDFTHPDLQGRMWLNERGEVGYDFFDNVVWPRDPNGHGTFVAGMIAAQNHNGVGISSPAGFHGKIMAVRTLGGDDAHPYGTQESVTNSIYFAADNGADVINMSFGGWGNNRGQQLAIEYALSKGALLVAASGNNASEINLANPFSPAIFGHSYKGMITVGAINLRDGFKAGFSNYSKDTVEIAAPGAGGIYSLAPRNSYKSTQGTSMAAPLVSGAAALVIGFLKAQGLPAEPSTVEEIILKGSNEIRELAPYFQSGRSLDYLTLAESLKDTYDVPDVKIPEPNGPRPDASIISETQRDGVRSVSGYICTKNFEIPGEVWGKSNGRDFKLEVTWDYHFAWQDECMPGNIIQHQFHGEYSSRSQSLETSYYLNDPASGAFQEIPRPLSP